MEKFFFAFWCLFFSTFSFSQENSTQEDDLEQIVFCVLLGDIAFFEGNFPIALEMWSQLAENTQNEKALTRAVHLAFLSKNDALARNLLAIWQNSHPQSQTAKEWFLKILMREKNYAQLKPYLEKELKNNAAQRAELILSFPTLFLMNPQNKEEKKEILFDLTKPYLNLKESHFVRAQIAFHFNDFDLIEKELNQALQIDSHYEEAVILKSAIYLEKNPQESARILQNYLKHNKQSEKARLNYMHVLITMGDIQNAIKIFKTLKKQDENIENLYSLTLLTLQKGFYKEGRFLLNQLEEYKNINLNQIYYLKAQIAIEEKNNQEALFYLEKITRQNNAQQYMIARAQLAQILAKEGKLEQARARLFVSETHNDFERIQFILNEAQILNEMNLNQEAFLFLEKMVKKFPKSVDLKYEWAMISDRLKNYSKMEEILHVILKQNPNHAHALNALGYSYADRGIHLKQAENLIQKALQFEKENPYILDSLAWVYFKQGKLKESLLILQKAFQIKEDAEIAIHLVEVFNQLNEKEQAEKILNQIMEKEKNHPAIQKFLEKNPRSTFKNFEK